MAFCRGFGRPSGGFWKGLAEFLEGPGASWMPGGLLRGVFHFWVAFYWILLCRLALGCIWVYFPIVFLFSAAFDCFC